MTTKTETRTAAERLNEAQSKAAALRIEDDQLADQLTRALLNGEDVTALRKRRHDIREGLSDLSLVEVALARFAAGEERKNLLADVEKAFARRQVLQQRIAQQEIIAEIDAKLEAAQKEHWRLKFAESDGVNSAVFALHRHRELHPDIIEDASTVVQSLPGVQTNEK